MADQLHDFVVLRMPSTVRVSVEKGWRPNKHTYLEPDMTIYPRGFTGNSVPPERIHVLIEVADSSLAFDQGLKAKVYASLGVPEYWVINAKTLETKVHLGPSEAGYAQISTHAASKTIAPVAVPALAVCIGSLQLE